MFGWRSLLIFTTSISAAIVGAENRQSLADLTEEGLSVSWQLVDNLPTEQFQSVIELKNDRDEPLANDWALYFNCARKLLPNSVGVDFELAHVNGDLYVLRPRPSKRSLAPGEHLTIPLTGSLWAINISDAPSGFFLVEKEKSGRPAKPIKLQLEVKPFPVAEKLRRGGSDTVAVESPESRYVENELLTKLLPEQLVQVVPTPKEIRSMPGRFAINASTKIFYDPSLRNEATFLAEAIGELVGGNLAIEEKASTIATPGSSIRLSIGEVKVAGHDKLGGDEAYVLTIELETGIDIVGSDSAGLLYGIQTLRGLVPIEAYRQKQGKISVAAVRIADAPRFRYRGLHLDVARNFQTRQTVEKLLDLMAFYKLNRFHLHLTDDEGWRIEIKQLPELTKIGSRRGYTTDEHKNLMPSFGSGPFPDAEKSPGSGYYSQEDVIKILQHAKARHIAVIPEIDLPGHARAAIKSMEARQRNSQQALRDKKRADLRLRDPADASKFESVQMWNDNVVDVGSEATYRFVEIVIDELRSIYQLAGVPLTSVHLGGDEVPNGVWEKSAACQKLALDTGSSIHRKGQLELHFLDRASEILDHHSIQPACWEDCLLLEATRDKAAGDKRRGAGKPTPTAYVWNNVWGWGQEDAAHKLANAGFDVVLCNATNLYFDLSCEKDPLEPGYYWAGFVGMRAPFEFVPLDVFKNAERTSMGHAVREETFASRTHLTTGGIKHILGIQGQLWGENLHSRQTLEYMAFPRIIALAERAWASSPDWADVSDPAIRKSKLQRDWNQFANRLGQRELPRLDYLSGGVDYRLPPPGAIVRDGRLLANVAFPGLEIRYTTDGKEPDQNAAVWHESIPSSSAIKLKSFDSRGRGSRTTNVGNWN